MKSEPWAQAPQYVYVKENNTRFQLVGQPESWCCDPVFTVSPWGF